MEIILKKINLKNWKNSAEKELKQKKLEELSWETPEGIKVKPLYTEDDIKHINHDIGLPGLPPYTRGPRATMYTLIDHGLLDNMLVFQLQKNQINFIKKD